MKHKGCILDFTHHRNSELMRAYRDAISKCDIISISEISEVVVNSPCARFWVSEERAYVICATLMRGEPLPHNMGHAKKEMFREIYNRVLKIKNNNTELSLRNMVLSVVNSPAPKFYMRPRSAMEIIYKIKKGFYDR